MLLNIATITLNPAYDMIGLCEQIALGEVNLVENISLHPAGKGINVAKVLNDLSEQVVNISVGGFLGEENKTDFIKLFEQLSFNNFFNYVDGKTRINVKLTEKNQRVTDLNFSGFKVSDKDWQLFVQNSLTVAKTCDIIAVCGSIPNGVTLTQFKNWLAELTKICPKIVLDTNRDALKNAIEVKPWLIKPNEVELADLVGKKLTTLDEIKAEAKKLVTSGISNVIVSLGEKGALWVTDEQIILAKPPYCKVVSTVGAGDSMVGAIIHGLINNWPIEKILTMASAVAAISVMQSGVGITDKKLLTEIISQVEVTTLS